MHCPTSICSSAMRTVRRFALDRSGATAVEYGLMVAMVSIAIMATIFATGEGIKVTLYERITTALASMM
jgi:pilus assembly protein Flp/PilA